MQGAHTSHSSGDPQLPPSAARRPHAEGISISPLSICAEEQQVKSSAERGGQRRRSSPSASHRRCRAASAPLLSLPAHRHRCSSRPAAAAAAAAAAESATRRRSTHPLHDGAGVLAVDLAAHRHGRAENLLAGARELPGAAARPHDARDLNHVLQGDAARVLDVLLLRDAAAPAAGNRAALSGGAWGVPRCSSSTSGPRPAPLQAPTPGVPPLRYAARAEADAAASLLRHRSPSGREVPPVAVLPQQRVRARPGAPARQAAAPEFVLAVPCAWRRTFFLSRGGSLSALMTSAAAEGTTDTLAWRFCTVSLTVMRRPFQSLAVSLAMSSPTFLGDRPRGPILGASDEAAPTSPPVTRTNTSATACHARAVGGHASSGTRPSSRISQRVLSDSRSTHSHWGRTWEAS